jgi:hypothetical protein
MKTNIKTRVLALALAVLLLFAVLPVSALAETAQSSPNVIDMTRGEKREGFLPASTICQSSDPSIAWVDGAGTLNALKPGTVTLSVYEGEDYTVRVADYADGSPVVGNLKLLARYNDSMQFYDGHVYLLFTSYQDGVEIYVDDLYGYYEISDQYYTDIREDIANGSNHTGSETEEYFSITDLNEPMVLNRGEIVTIGMYRGFDLSVPQAALGSIKNSSYWSDIVKAGKSAVIENIFNLLEGGKINMEEALNRVKNALAEIGVDYNVALDGVVEGGVCFNRELYNQKLEWDQYENVTYEMDITENQLDTLVATLGGNLNRFSILKNSCATVALRAWNAAVGTTDGEPNAYYLDATGSGIFALVDAPKTVRDSIVDKLPGYYLNNSEGVEEPDAGYQDDTGWVYVSAPEKISPVNYQYRDEKLMLNTDVTNVSALIRAIDPDADLTYTKDEATIYVDVKAELGQDSGTVTGVDFTVNGKTYTFDGNTELDEFCDMIWFMTPYADPDEGMFNALYDDEGNDLPGYCEDGMLYLSLESLPVSYHVVPEPIPEEEEQNEVSVHTHGGYETNIATEAYYKDGDEKIPVDIMTPVTPGKKVYIKPVLDPEYPDVILANILLYVDGVESSILDEEHYDAEEGAYFVIIPEGNPMIIARYGAPEITAKKPATIQAMVGDTFDLEDCVEIAADGFVMIASESMEWKLLQDDSIFSVEDGILTVGKKGVEAVWACCKTDESVGVPFVIEAFDPADEPAAITASDEFLSNMLLTVYNAQGEPTGTVLRSGYLVDKGSVIALTPIQDTAVLPYNVTANGTALKVGDTYTVTGDTTFKASFYEAQVKNMPKTVTLAAQGDTYQLEAKVSYTGLINQLKTVYDDSITYVSSDPLIAVDEKGLVTVAGAIPEDGAAVIVTAYAGSGNRQVYAQTKVTVGDYQGDKIVGRLTIHSRSISSVEPTPHGALTFTTYDDIDLDVSYYEFYEPNAKYKALMQDYQAHPENYNSDPAVCNDNELGLTDRESYFDIHTNGPESDPATISLKAGESISVSNYSFDRDNLVTVYKALSGTAAMTNAKVAELVSQMEAYGNDEEIDGASAFDNFLSALVYMVSYYSATGQNPADGHSNGGIMVNREMYNQFRRNDTQLPNNYYTIEITADELAAMKAFLADPANNYYSLFVKNCATGATDVWNAALFDKPELHLSASFIGVASEPQSLYYEIYLLRFKDSEKQGEFGRDFTPHCIAYSQNIKDTIALIDAIGTVEFTPACKAKIAAARAAYDALSEVEQAAVYNEGKLVDAEAEYRAFEDAETYKDSIRGDADCDNRITILDATNIQRVLASLGTTAHNRFAADVDGDGKVTIIDATFIQRYLASLSCPAHIGEPVFGN